jgi:hypothetical protein
MGFFHNNALVGASGAAAAGFQIDRSLRFNDDDSAYLSKVFASAGDRKKWTWSGWAKRSTADNTTNLLFYAETSASAYTQIGWSGDNFQLNIAYSASSFAYIRAAAESRDVSAWAHYVVVYDSANATSTDRMILYINGTRVTDFQTSSFPTQDALSPLNANTTHYIGTRKNVNQYFDGYLAEVHFVDGQALAPTDFGESDADTGVWNPIQYSGTHGTNGFYLDFSDNTSTTTIGEDSSGNGNDFTAANISVTAGADNDSLIDTPMNYEASSGNNGGNYATFNPVGSEQNANAPLVNGNLEFATSGYTSTCNTFVSTIAVSSGKWYFEGESTNNNGQCAIGIIAARFVEETSNNGKLFGQFSDGYAYEADGGNKSNNNTSTAYGSAWRSPGNIVGCAFDADNGTLEFFVNNVSQGVAFSSIPQGSYYLAIGVSKGSSASNQGMICTFGQRPFEYTPPTGYLSLCTQNLPDPTIADSSTAMDTLLYVGNATARSITGLDFAPDLVWIKNRSQGDYHLLTDTVRGATKQLTSSLTNAEATNTQGLTAFNSDGFDIGTHVFYNTNNENYVAWSWDAGTSTVTNTDGTHSAQVRANSSTGFSISTHSRTTAASISTWGHGLNAAPEFAILKPYNGAYNWIVWHKDMGNRKRIFLNSTSAGNTYGFDVWSSDSTTLGIYGTIIAGGGTALDCVTYAWTPIEGYSRFGFYEANGNADGPFVFTGFTPKLIMTKDIDSTSNWNVYDTSRDTYNVADAKLSWNLNNAESTLAAVDILSNGFKIRTNNADMNENTRTFIYCAWAENPFKTARAR